MGVFQLPWTVIGISMALAIIATYFAASRPAKTIAKVPVVAALAGRPPAPKKTRHLAIPVGLCFLVGAFLLLGAAGATAGSGGGQNKGMLELVVGFVALTVAIVLLAPACLSVVAAAGGRSPVAIRLALRDLARYRARSGQALAAISLSTLIAVIICVVSAARFGNVLDYAGPNLSSNQLIVYARRHQRPLGGSRQQPDRRPDRGRAKGREGHRRRARHDQPDRARETSANLVHAASGRSWSGPIYVATPQLLSAFGIKQSETNPDADILTMRPGLSTMSQMQLIYGGQQGAARPRPGDGPNSNVALPCGKLYRQPAHPGDQPAPVRYVRTEHSGHRTRDHHTAPAKPITTAGWLIQVPNGLTAMQVTDAQRIAAAAGMGVETRNSIPSLAQITDAATLFGIVLAIGILGMSVGLVRSEAARDLRTLTATGAAASHAARSQRRPRARSRSPAPWSGSPAGTSRRSASSAATRSTACRR